MRGVGDDDPQSGSAGHRGQPRRRETRIQRYVSAAGPPHAEQRRQHAGAAPDAQPDRRFRADAAVGESPGDPGGAIAQLAHRRGPVAIDDPGCRCPEQAPDVRVVVVAGRQRLVVAPDDQRVALRRRQHQQVGHPGAGSVRRLLEQVRHAAQEPLGPRRAEEVCAVFQHQRRGLVVRGVHVHGEVEFRGPGEQRPGVRGDTRKVEHGRRERPVDELDLRECRMRERAVRREIVDELLEREFLVQQRIHGGVPDPAEQPGEGRIVS